MVDEHTGQPVPDGPLHQRGRHRGVDATGQAADRPPVTDLRPHLLDQRVGDVGRRPHRVDAGELVQEAAEHLLAVRAVHDLGVVLHPGEAPRPVLERRDWCSGTGGDDVEPGRSRGDGVTVAHPHRLGLRQIGMQLTASHFQVGTTVLTGAGVRHGATEGLGHGLEAVADAEHRHVEVEEFGIQLRGAFGVDTGRPAGQHHGARIPGLDLLDAGGVRDDLRVHPRLPDATRDQLCVLRAEIDDQHGTGGC